MTKNKPTEIWGKTHNSIILRKKRPIAWYDVVTNVSSSNDVLHCFKANLIQRNWDINLILIFTEDKKKPKCLERDTAYSGSAIHYSRIQANFLLKRLENILLVSHYWWWEKFILIWLAVKDKGDLNTWVLSVGCLEITSWHTVIVCLTSFISMVYHWICI